MLAQIVPNRGFNPAKHLCPHSKVWCYWSSWCPVTTKWRLAKLSSGASLWQVSSFGNRTLKVVLWSVFRAKHHYGNILWAGGQQLVSMYYLLNQRLWKWTCWELWQIPSHWRHFYSVNMIKNSATLNPKCSQMTSIPKLTLQNWNNEIFWDLGSLQFSSLASDLLSLRVTSC